MPKNILRNLGLSLLMGVLALPGSLFAQTNLNEMTFNEQHPLRIGVVLFDGFESLDAFGPIEVFGTLTPRTKIVTLGQKPVFRPRGGPAIAVDFTFNQAPKLDLLIIPGGLGTRALVGDQKFLDDLAKLAASVPKVASVCTGSALLAKAGILDGHKATSNKRSFQWVAAQSDKVHWVYESRWVDDGKYATSSGVSAGIDLSLALESEYFGIEQARQTAQQIEYVWDENAVHDPFAEVNRTRNDPHNTSPLQGIVVEVNADQKLLTVRHQEVPGVMAAMTMSFHVDSVDGIHPGDPIQALIYQEKGVWKLKEIKPVSGDN